MSGASRPRGGPDDHRVVRLELSSAGEQIVADLSSSHLEELARLGPLLRTLLDPLAIR